jgi:hypothetical protein
MVLHLEQGKILIVVVIGLVALDPTHVLKIFE